MTQTILTVAFEVPPANAASLEHAITDFRMREEQTTAAYERLKDAVPTLHFMAMMVFRDPHYDPIFLLEVNFDGTRSAFWNRFAGALGADLRGILAFCAEPRGEDAAGAFRAFLITGDGLPEVLDAAAVTPTASHLGNRGLARAQIEEEAALFVDLQDELARGDRRYRARTPADIHRDLRAALRPAHPGLDAAALPRVGAQENLVDWVRLGLFAAVLGAALDAPGALLASVVGPVITAILAIAASVFLYRRVPGLASSPGAASSFAVLVLVAIGVLAVVGAVGTAIGCFVLWFLASFSNLLGGDAPPPLDGWMLHAFYDILAGATGAFALVLAGFLWLRWLEQRDSTSTAPALGPAVMRAIEEREDHVVQNHMGSIVLVKPGVLRTIALRAGHHALHLVLRVMARDGYLNDMRTVHFAHWALLNNGGRLLFLSNFDGTWDSYLDDFIEKAHPGTTLAWANGTGAPLAEFLFRKGVTNGRQFKAWARRSMTPNLFWFSAYPTLTVNQIERNHLVAEGLRQRSLDAAAAAQWARNL